jgi:dimethylglycine dehydrogenase
VTGIRRDNGEWIVETPKGDVRCAKVVNAAGYYADKIWEMFRPYSACPERHLPMVTLAHQYLITGPIAELTARDSLLPLLRDPDSSYDLRQEKDGLLLGPYERACRAHWHEAGDPTPDDFSFQLYPDDLDRLDPARPLGRAPARVRTRRRDGAPPGRRRFSHDELRRDEGRLPLPRNPRPRRRLLGRR